MGQTRSIVYKRGIISRLFGRNTWQLYLLAILPVSVIVIFNYFPMGGVLIAFKDYTFREGILGSPWVGFKYFDQLFSSPIFKDILRNTIILSIQSLVIAFPFPIILALAYNEVASLKLKKSLQTISFAPYFISTVVVISILTQMFSFRYGIVNEIVKLFGAEPINFFGANSFFRPAYIWSGVWQGAGYSSILYLAALSAVDVTLYEAAAIDGATRLQKVWHIDLPSMMPVIVITLILSAGGILNVGFEKVLLLQNPLNYTVSEVISTYVYKSGIQQAQFSFSTAVGLFNSVVNCIVLLLVNRIAKTIGETSLF